MHVVACDRCGFSMRTPHEPERCHRNCSALFPRPWEFGHWLSLWLEVFGVSKRRWYLLRLKMGLAKPCGCAKREQQLNTFGERLSAIFPGGSPTQPVSEMTVMGNDPSKTTCVNQPNTSIL